MAIVDDSPCPVCGAAGTLSLGQIVVVRPLGTWSLAGNQLKAPGVFRPALTCSACGLRVVGRYDDDGRHVTFPAPDTPA